MPIRMTLLCASLCLLAQPAAAHSGARGGIESAELAVLETLANGAHRSEAHRARNAYRHPVATLAFFGLAPDMTVVEISPGGAGWYTEILAPFLRERGKLYAASYDPESESEYAQRNARRFADKLAEHPEIYDRVEVTVFAPPEKLDIAPPGSADMVVTFRNFHGWMRDGHADAVLAAVYRVLRPGGVFGVVQHRAAPGSHRPETGYVGEEELIAAARAAGFRLDLRSELNANPADTRDHPEGVWTLPPSLRLGERDRARYLAIGESDRMTLRFVKPRR